MSIGTAADQGEGSMTMANHMEHLSTGGIILYTAIILLAAFSATRLTKLIHLPNVTGYMLAGILIGPCCLGIISQCFIDGADFITDIALAFIAFGVGKYFKLATLKKGGSRIAILTICESLTAGFLITVVMLFWGYSMSFCLLLGAIGCATAPASTVMTIRQYKAKGPFIDTLLQVVALDDAVALIAFSICAAFVGKEGGEGISAWDVVLPILYHILSVLLGLLLGVLLSKINGESRSREHSLVLATVVILGLAGLCSSVNISPLLACMASGAAYVNVSGDKRLFKRLNQFTPPILVLFFVLSGMRLRLSLLMTAGLTGIVYFMIRIAGKYLGAYLGGKITNCSTKTTQNLGLALIPQAGVSIGLAILAQRILPAASGQLLSTIILSSGILYEMIGPACAKYAIRRSGSIPGEKNSSFTKPEKTVT